MQDGVAVGIASPSALGQASRRRVGGGRATPAPPSPIDEIMNADATRRPRPKPRSAMISTVCPANDFSTYVGHGTDPPTVRIQPEASSHSEAHDMADSTLNDYQSIREARTALQHSGLPCAALEACDQVGIARWMWRHDASPQEAAIAFGIQPPAMARRPTR